MKNAALTANGLPHGHDGYNQHDQDQSGECLPQQVAGIGVRDETKVSLLRVDKQYHHGRRGRKAQQCGEGEEGGEPAGAVEEVAVGGAGEARGVVGPPVQRVNEDGAKVANDLGGAEPEAIAGRSSSS